MKKYKNKVDLLKQQITKIETELREQIYNAINEIAQEQTLNKISNSIFIVKFSDLCGKPWSAGFNNWQESAKILTKKLENKNALDIYDYLLSLYEQRNKNNNCTIKFRTYMKYRDFTIYEDKTETLDANFIKKIIDRLDETL
jgi:hypothetical protein